MSTEGGLHKHSVACTHRHSERFLSLGKGHSVTCFHMLHLEDIMLNAESQFTKSQVLYGFTYMRCLDESFFGRELVF